MNKYNKNKIAITLLSALACSANTSAKDFGIKNSENLPVKTSDFSTNKNLKLDVKSPQTLDKLGEVAHINSKTGNITLKKFNKLNITMPVLLFSSGAFCTLILNEIFNKDFNIRSLFKSKREKCSSNLDFIYKKLNGDKDAIKAFEYLKSNLTTLYSSYNVETFVVDDNKNKKLYRNGCICKSFNSVGMPTYEDVEEIDDKKFEELKNEYKVAGKECYLKKLEEVFSEKCYLSNFELECAVDEQSTNVNKLKVFKFKFCLKNNEVYEIIVHNFNGFTYINSSKFIFNNIKKTVNHKGIVV